MPKFAHFEDISASRIHHVYTRHAEVARDIHQQAAREFSGQDITVRDMAVSLVNPYECSPILSKLTPNHATATITDKKAIKAT